MNRFLLLLIPFTILTADDDYDGYVAEAAGSAISVEFDYDSIGKAGFKDDPYKGQNVTFKEAKGLANIVWCYNPAKAHGSYLVAGYTSTWIDWKDNPYFDQTQFQNLNLGVGFFSKRLGDWDWQSRALMNWNIEHGPPGRYLTYDLLLWGRYIYTADIGLHCGFCAYTGMRIDWVYPVVGFDWQVTDKWKVNGVFPLDLSVAYQFTCNLSASGAVRFFIERQRVAKNEPLPQALVEYKNRGLELNVDYKLGSKFQLNLHAGSTIGGRMKISNSKHHNGTKLDLDSSGYFGGELKASF